MRSALILLLVASGVGAHTLGNVDYVCPLDGTKFTAITDFSGTTFGKRLDLKPLGPTPAP